MNTNTDEKSCHSWDIQFERDVMTICKNVYWQNGLMIRVHGRKRTGGMSFDQGHSLDLVERLSK